MKVQEAVADPEWQKFRVSLKGLPTEDKLRRLQLYYYLNGVDGYEHREPDKIDLQVDNYIKSLCRGGQLYPGESLATMIEQGWKPDIKK